MTKIWVGVTDGNWFESLRDLAPDEVNFWQPSSTRRFTAIEPGAPFLFKLHSPRNYIVGGGFFVRHTALPCSLAWSAFGEKNGVADLENFRTRIHKYRRSDRIEWDPTIGCSILTEPFFWPEDKWIPVPADWAKNIVQGKTYDTDDAIGAELWHDVLERLVQNVEYKEVRDGDHRYGVEYLARARLGQGAFRILVTEAYQQRCAITGGRILPVLEASHIRPFAAEGPNRVSNGLLLRSDLHTLFDRGYLTVTPNFRIEVSKRIKEEFANGTEYYAHHGNALVVLPGNSLERPAAQFLRWHNQHVYENADLEGPAPARA